jgi:hypothetical protein
LEGIAAFAWLYFRLKGLSLIHAACLKAEKAEGQILTADIMKHEQSQLFFVHAFNLPC